MTPVDLRSDTVTRPTPQMRAAMCGAMVGDDVFGEDPTVNQLEARVAQLLGKEAALFVVSGTMANQLAIRCQTRPGDAIALDHRAHPYRFEGGASALLSGVTCRPLHSERGLITPDLVEPWYDASDNVHFTPLRLVCVENTHNVSGGAVISPTALAPLLAFCREREIRTHLDGARLFNASTALGMPPASVAAGFDSVSICFSKGLGAPVGSAIAGSKEMIALARRMRKVLGGGWRQAGMLAAAANYALDHHITRLADDHRRARQLAEALTALGNYSVAPVESNIVMISTALHSAARITAELSRSGILCLALPGDTIRLVVHLEITDDTIERTINAFRRIA